MKVVMLSSLLVFVFSVTSVAFGQNQNASQAKAAERAQAIESNKSVDGKWSHSKSSVLTSQGLNIVNPNQCEKFDVEISDKLFQFKLRCGAHFSSGLMPLISGNSQYQVRRGENSLMIIKMGYYGLKIQTGQARRELVKVPFVEEIFRFKVFEDKTMSFYREQFKVDDYGRIVQSNYLQAFGLTKKVLKISSLEN